MCGTEGVTRGSIGRIRLYYIVNFVVNYFGSYYAVNFVVNYSEIVYDKVHGVVNRNSSRQSSRDSAFPCLLSLDVVPTQRSEKEN